MSHCRLFVPYHRITLFTFFYGSVRCLRNYIIIITPLCSELHYGSVIASYAHFTSEQRCDVVHFDQNPRFFPGRPPLRHELAGSTSHKTGVQQLPLVKQRSASASYHLSLVNIPRFRTMRFSFSFVIPYKEWDALLTSV